MRKLFPLILLAVITQHIQGQNGIAGYWRAVSVVPDGRPDGAVLQFTMELMVEGASVTGTVTGAPIAISGGRVEGTSVTLNGINTDNKQPTTLTGSRSWTRLENHSRKLPGNGSSFHSK